MRKGVTPVMATLLTLVVLIVAFLIFFMFQQGAFMQEKGIIHKQISATGEIPCTRAATVKIQEDVEGAVYINTSADAAYNLTLLTPRKAVVPTLLNATISSGCLENLTVTWDFGDGTPAVETYCSYITGMGYATWNSTAKDWTNENCTFANHTYVLRSTDDLWATEGIRVSAYGDRSGFYAEATTLGFVLDPEFRVYAGPPDTDEFSCVKFVSTVHNIKGLVPLDQVQLDILDNRQLITADQANTNKGISYRAPVRSNEGAGTRHKVQVLATKGFQTAKSNEVLYESTELTPAREISVFGHRDGMDIYNSGLSQYLDRALLPETDYVQIDLDTRDLDNDGAAEFALLMANQGGQGGNLYVQPYSGLKPQSYASKLTPDQLKQMWSVYQDLPGDVWWQAVAIGNKITASNGNDVGNIVVLGNPGNLDLYKYSAGQLTLVERGGDFTKFTCTYGVDCNDWQDVAVADINGDGEDEIIALRGSSNWNTGDLYIFKYGDYAKVDNKEPYWIDIDNENWVGVAAGKFYNHADRTDILALSDDGLTIIEVPKSGKPPEPVNLKEHNWPHGWRDIELADINNDDKDEAILLNKDSSGAYKVVTFGYSLSFTATPSGAFKDYGNSLNNANFTSIPVTLMDTSTNSIEWNAVAAGDVGCFL